MLLYVLLAVFGGFAGVTTVLFGFGGGFVVVPLLYRLLTALHATGSAVALSAMQIAVATSTCVMVFGAGMATRRHQRAGTLDWTQIRPLLVPIAMGSVLGAAAAAYAHGEWLRWAFVAYLALTMLDCVFRPGFLCQPGAPESTASRRTDLFAGLAIGAVAALLGVGGSVMTVPLMRRRGAGMTAATAMANPLSLPVALAGTATYVLLAAGATPSLGAWHVGYVDLRALFVLIGGSWLGIRLAAPWIGRIPDGLHARVYLVLLGAVLLAMLIR